MTDLIRRRIELTTGVGLDVTLGGPEHAAPLLFLHGFPESARTWRHQLDQFAPDYRVAAPDQRGFARSSKPTRVEDYQTKRLVADVVALANALGFKRFTLVGHDWGGAVAWAVALKYPERVAQLVVVNAPHPYLFQRSLFDDPAQRAASQYIRAYRSPTIAADVIRAGLENFLDASLAPHMSSGVLTARDRAAYLDEWSQPGAIEAMFNWYKASPIFVPETDQNPARPAWIDEPFPKTQMPVLVVWGTKDTALLPVLLEGLGNHVPDLRVVKVDAGHFVPWERPEPVTAAIRAFLENGDNGC